ncbi:MAG: MarR family transcriptional regulator [Sphaerochaetaceae bacterium]|nr:MarR family transcriptional regulator [Sphaerochaetaceae bacterium]
MGKELKLFIALNKAVTSFTKKTNKIVTQYDITYSQFAVLEVLYHKGALSVGEVKEKILSSSGTIAIIIKNLEKNDLIVKFQDNKDKRKYILKLTNKGMNLISEVFPKNEEMIINSMNVLNFAEQEYMLNCLKKISGYKR